MAIVFARAAFPVWVVILGFAAFLAPAGMATTALVAALCLVCLPAVITIGAWKRNVRQPTSDVMTVWHNVRHPPDIIEADFTHDKELHGD